MSRWAGKLTAYLNEIDNAAHEQVELLIRQMTAAKQAGIGSQASRGRHSLVRNEVTQNRPDFNTHNSYLAETEDFSYNEI